VVERLPRKRKALGSVLGGKKRKKEKKDYANKKQTNLKKRKVRIY